MTFSAIRLVNPSGPSCSASYTVAMPPSATLFTSRNAPLYSTVFWLSMDGEFGRRRREGLLQSCLARRRARTLTDGSRTPRHHDHRRRPNRAVRLVLCWYAPGFSADSECSSGSRRTAHGAVSREI